MEKTRIEGEEAGQRKGVIKHSAEILKAMAGEGLLPINSIIARINNERTEKRKPWLQYAQVSHALSLLEQAGKVLREKGGNNPSFRIAARGTERILTEEEAEALKKVSLPMLEGHNLSAKTLSLLRKGEENLGHPILEYMAEESFGKKKNMTTILMEVSRHCGRDMDYGTVKRVLETAFIIAEMGPDYRREFDPASLPPTSCEDLVSMGVLKTARLLGKLQEAEARLDMPIVDYIVEEHHNAQRSINDIAHELGVSSVQITSILAALRIPCRTRQEYYDRDDFLRKGLDDW